MDIWDFCKYFFIKIFTKKNVMENFRIRKSCNELI